MQHPCRNVAQASALLAVLVASGGPVPAAARLRHYSMVSGTLNATHEPLSALNTQRQPSALEPAFFHNNPVVQPGQYGTGVIAVHNDVGCHPKCFWTCGDAACDEVCDPVCAPPQCETACEPLNLATCRQQCDPPRCAIVCPSMHCEHGDCPMCKTVCSPPKCETICHEQCESKCALPQCSWKCNPGKCEKPTCSLTCGGAKMCNFDKDVNAKPDWKAGMHTVAAGLAAYDPSSLGVAAPPEVFGVAPAPAGVQAPAAAPPALVR